MQPTSTSSWQKLTKQHQTLSDLSQLKLQNQNFKASTHNISLDFSNQLLDEKTLQLLLELAQECNLDDKIKALMAGEVVNLSENRPALHSALRVFDNQDHPIKDKTIIQDVLGTRLQMKEIANQIRQGLWLGSTGKPIKAIVNLGIGGSQLGPMFCLSAFKDISLDTLSYHFVSDIDPNAFRRATKKLNPETTLFIVSSKSFTTQETLYNAKKAFAWIGDSKNIDKHFIAVTANVEKAKAFGFNKVLPMWDWVGGRYSLCSAISLITCIAIGFEAFETLLQGAHEMDNHFYTEKWSSNLPILLALLGIWNINFLDIQTLLMLTYAQELELLVPYLQQLDMESNGKSLDTQGRPVHYATGPIIWGGLGNQAQHSYYQLLCQGTHKIATDLISVECFNGEVINKMCEAQKTVLSQGVPADNIAGNTPLNHIRLKDASPRSIGALVAMYEHKVFVQSVIWNINAFDQPGVESSKRLTFSQAPHQ